MTTEEKNHEFIEMFLIMHDVINSKILTDLEKGGANQKLLTETLLLLAAYQVAFVTEVLMSGEN